MLRVSLALALDFLRSACGEALGLMPRRQTSCTAQPVQRLKFDKHAFSTVGHPYHIWHFSAVASSVQKVTMTVLFSILVRLLDLFPIK